MKTTRKVLIIVAAVCIAVGVIISAGAFAASGFRSGGIWGKNDYEVKTHYVSEKFEKVEINSVDADISIIPYDSSDEAKVECLSSERVTYDVAVEGDTLTITRKDDTRWWEHIGFFINVPSFTVKVYLPVKCYEALSVTSVSGEISMDSGLIFIDAYLKTVSGDIECNATVTETFKAYTTSGELDATAINGADVLFQTTSGDASFSKITASNIELSSVSGEMCFSSVFATESVKLRTTSGDIELNGFDADGISIKTVSGDVDGRLYTDKNFDINTTSGDVRVPQSVGSAPLCEVNTTSGDVRFVVRGY